MMLSKATIDFSMTDTLQANTLQPLPLLSLRSRMGRWVGVAPFLQRMRERMVCGCGLRFHSSPSHKQNDCVVKPVELESLCLVRC